MFRPAQVALSSFTSDPALTTDLPSLLLRHMLSRATSYADHMSSRAQGSYKGKNVRACFIPCPVRSALTFTQALTTLRPYPITVHLHNYSPHFTSLISPLPHLTVA